MQEENAKLRSIVEVLEINFNNLEHYCRHSNTNVPGILDSVSNHEREYLVVKFMKAIDIEIDDPHIEACHQISKSKGNSKKTTAHFRKCKKSKRVVYNKKKLASSKYQQLV